VQHLVVSRDGLGLPLALRMQEEGADVSAFIAVSAYRGKLEGILKNPVHNAQHFRSAVAKLEAGSVVLFDGLRALTPGAAETEEPGTEGEAADDEGRSLAGIDVRDFGQIAVRLRRRGLRVVGCSPHTEAAEVNRLAGKKLAERVGLTGIEHREFTSARALLGHLREHRRERFVLRSAVKGELETIVEEQPGDLLERFGRSHEVDLGCQRVLLEPFVPGFEYREEAWWTGERFVHVNGSIDLRRAAAGEVGQDLGTTISATWCKRRPLVAWETLGPWLRESGYLGPVSARLLVDGGLVRFVGWRMHLDRSSVAFLALLRRPLAPFLEEHFVGGLQDGEFAAAIRLRAAARPGRPLRAQPRGFAPQDVREGQGGLETAGRDGELGLAVGVESELLPALRNAAAVIPQIGFVERPVYRTDVASVVDAWQSLSRFGLAH